MGQFPDSDDVPGVENRRQKGPAFAACQGEPGGADGKGRHPQQDEAHSLKDPVTGEPPVPQGQEQGHQGQGQVFQEGHGMDFRRKQAAHFASHDGKQQEPQEQALPAQAPVFVPGPDQRAAEHQGHHQECQGEPVPQSLERRQFLHDEFGKEKGTAPGQDDQRHKDFGGSGFHTKTSL